MDDWQAAQHADELKRREEVIAALRHAHQLGLAESECMALAYEAGVANDFFKEIRQ